MWICRPRHGSARSPRRREDRSDVQGAAAGRRPAADDGPSGRPYAARRVSSPTKNRLFRWLQGSCACLAIVLLSSACTGGDTATPSANPESPEQAPDPPSAAPLDIQVQRLRASAIPSLPRLAAAVPGRVPVPTAIAQPLLSNLPGSALMTYHPPENFRDQSGWLGEDILFYGADGEWRRLPMADLGLPASAWPGPDTFGAGELSPDGRWWTADSGAGAIIVNLSTGRVQLVDLSRPFMTTATWLPDSQSFVVRAFGGGNRERSLEVNVRNGSLTPTPYDHSDVGFEPDGTPISLERTEGGVQLVEWNGQDKVSRGALTPTLTLAEAAVGAWSTPTNATFFASHHGRTATTDIVTADLGTRTVGARLAFSRQGYLVHSVEGWLDPKTLLIKTADHLIAWRPDVGRLYRVTDFVPAGANSYSTVSVAVDVG